MPEAHKSRGPLAEALKKQKKHSAFAENHATCTATDHLLSEGAARRRTGFARMPYGKHAHSVRFMG